MPSLLSRSNVTFVVKYLHHSYPTKTVNLSFISTYYMLTRPVSLLNTQRAACREPVYPLSKLKLCNAEIHRRLNTQIACPRMGLIPVLLSQSHITLIVTAPRHRIRTEPCTEKMVQ